MIKIENLHNVLKNFNFIEDKGIWTRQYTNDTSIKVDFTKQTIEYEPVDNSFKNGEYPTIDKPAKGFIKHRDTILNFSANENFVCLVCVHLLLEKGYEPKHIVFEPAFKVGHVNKQSYGDILVFDKNYKPLVLIENKTYGTEFSAEWNNMQKDGGQLFSYLGPTNDQIGLCNYLVLFACDFDERLVLKSHIITLIDNDKRIADLKDPITFKNRDPSFEVWDKTYAKSFETKGLFEDDIAPYSVGKTKYTVKDLKSLSHAEIRPIYHEFATILRNHAITDFEHSFYILIDLFLCKITDERNNPNDLQFYYKGISRDTPKEYCSRLLKLYKQGKQELFGVNVVNKEESDIKQIFDDTNRSLTNGLFAGIKKLFEEIKFYNIKKFNFIDVENKEEFELNFQILIKITALIQDINLSNSETNHFFGDLFEGLLSKNVHQTEGQFFTPLPIVNFIIKSLPQFNNSKDVKVLDYACGAGHFLTEFLKTYPNSEVFGIEKSQPLSQVAKIATIINGAKENSHIVFKDALSYLNDKEIRFAGFSEESFDCIIANPPYSVKGFLNTLTKTERNKFELFNSVNDTSLDSKRNIECFFVERAKYFLKRHGIMGIILPSSILTNGEIYIKTRELLFENFNILSIVSLGSRTFGSTGTNTIILFAQKVKNKNSQALMNAFMEKTDYTIYTNHKALDDYIVKQNYNKEDYFAFMQDNILSNNLEGHEIFVEYKKNFKKEDIKKSQQKELFKKSEYYQSALKESSKEYKELFSKCLDSHEYKIFEQDEYRKQFISFAKEIEKDKLKIFIQIYSNDVAILQSPPDKIGSKSNKKEIIEFLGYDWSNRKGDEGIKYVVDKSTETEDLDNNEEDEEIIETVNSIKYIKTPLYNPNDDYDCTKYAFALRKHNCEQCKKFSFDFQPSNKLNNLFENNEDKYLHYAKLSDMIDFSKTNFDKAIKLNIGKKQIEFKSKYPLVKLGEYCFIKGGDTFKNKYQGNTNSSDIPFFKVGDMNTIGNEVYMTISNNYVEKDVLKNKLKATIFKKNTIVFPKVGMAIHTNKKRILGRDASVDNNTMAVWIKNEKILSYIYLYNYFISNINLSYVASTSNPPSISEDNLAEIKIPLPPLEIQQCIVSECEQIDEGCNNTNNNITNYKQQIIQIINSISNSSYKFEKINEICNINSKNIDPTKTPTQEFTYIDISSVVNGEGYFYTNKIITGKNAPSRARRLVSVGSTIISTVRPNLKGFAYVDTDLRNYVFSTGFAILNSKDTNILVDKYLYFNFMYSNSLMNQMINAMPKGQYPSITENDILNFSIPVPSVEEQNQIISQIEELQSKINESKKIISTSADRKKQVLEKYLC